MSTEGAGCSVHRCWPLLVFGALFGCGSDEVTPRPVPGHGEGGQGGADGASGESGDGGRADPPDERGGSGVGGGAAGAPEAGAGGVCSGDDCECSDGELGCPCDDPADCSSGFDCHPTLGCATVCGADDGVIETRSDFEALVAKDCNVIAGSLRLTATDLESLDGLETLHVVEGDVRIQGCDTVVDVRGLSGLMTIAGSLVLEGNAILERLDGLEGLRSAGAEGPASLVIAENELLEDIAALRFANLSDMSLTLTENPRLASLSGLVGARSAESVIIVHNEALASLDGLAGLIDTGGLTIADNPLLLDLNLPALRGAANLTLTGNSRLTTARLRSLLSAEMSVTVVGNTVLENLDMRKLTSVGGTLSITANPALNSFVLDSLQSVSALTISSNASLPQCEVDELDVQLGGVCGSACTGNDSSALCQ